MAEHRTGYQRLPFAECRMLNRCWPEWMPVSFLRGRDETLAEALGVLTDLEERGLVIARSGDGPEFKITDAGIWAVMFNGPVFAEPE